MELDHELWVHRGGLQPCGEVVHVPREAIDEVQAGLCALQAGLCALQAGLCVLQRCHQEGHCHLDVRPCHLRNIGSKPVARRMLCMPDITQVKTRCNGCIELSQGLGLIHGCSVPELPLVHAGAGTTSYQA